MIKDKNSQHHLQIERIKSTNHKTNKKPNEYGDIYFKNILFKGFFNDEVTYK